MKDLVDYLIDRGLDDAFKYGFDNNIDGKKILKHTFPASRLVAIYEEEVYPVSIYIGPSWGTYLQFADKKISCLDRYLVDGKINIGGAQVYDVHTVKIHSLIAAEDERIKQLHRSIKSAEIRKKGLENLQADHPEYFI